MKGSMMKSREQLESDVARLQAHLARKKCYLTAHIDPETLQIVGVSTYSEPPWLLTKIGDGVIYAILLEAEAETFHEAHEQIRPAYPVYHPDLAARFPLPDPGPATGEAVVVAIAHEPGWGPMATVDIRKDEPG